MSISSINRNFDSRIHLGFSALRQAMSVSCIHILVAIAVGVLFLSVISIITQGSMAYAQATDTIHTEEYYSNTTDEEQRNNLGGNLGYINADVAYAMEKTGKNVRVGVLDSNNFLEHPEFLAKLNSYSIFADDYEPVANSISDKSNYMHGIHVAGIIAAAKDNKEMHGVAYDADFYAIAYPGEGRNSGLLDFIDIDDIFIINNSWGSGYGMNLAEYDSFDYLFRFDNYNSISTLLRNRDILLVFGAGNDGRSSPGQPASLPSYINGTNLWNGTKVFPLRDDVSIFENMKSLGFYYDESNIFEFGKEIKNNLISVMSFNHRYDSSSILFISPFSNLADGATEYSLLAPGQDILSTTKPATIDVPLSIWDEIIHEYEELDGTSMAAPHVSGVAALVRQAFPYFEGKQLGDVLLSTAQKLTIKDGKLPPFVLLHEKLSDDDDDWNVVAYTYIDNPEKKYFSSRYSDDIHEYAHIYQNNYGNVFEATLRVEIQNALEIGNLKELTLEQYEGLFGQGIVDAGRAVQGPGNFDAFRLETSDIQLFVNGENIDAFWMYPVNTMGYDSIWSNDIGENPRPYAGIDGQPHLHVGLEKTGLGILSLAGHNTYEGPTLVKDGGIRLEGGRISGRLEVEEHTSLSGYGTVAGEAIVKGSMSPSGYLTDSGYLDFGGLTFVSGLILTETAQLNFDLVDRELYVPAIPGINYDSITLFGGNLILDGTLNINAPYAGTYVLFDYSYANYDGDFFTDYTFNDINVSNWAGNFTFNDDKLNGLISIIISYVDGQVNRIWEGTGTDGSEWTLNSGKWLDGPDFVNGPGNVLTFRGAGENIVLSDPSNPMHFDTLIFDSDGYVISSESNGKLQINLSESSWVGSTILVYDDFTTRIEANILSDNNLLIKKGTGTLVLGTLDDSDANGGSAISGPVWVENGTLAIFTDRSFQSLKGGVTVAAGAQLVGTARVGGATTINGVLSPGTDTNAYTKYGTYIFDNGLTLSSTATLRLDLDSYGAPGVRSDIIMVTGGTLTLAGTLDVMARVAGTYILIDYNGATYSGDINNDFHTTIYNDNINEFSLTELYNDIDRKLITLTLSRADQISDVWYGIGATTAWHAESSPSSSFVYKMYNWRNNGNSITFTGQGEEILFSALNDYNGRLMAKVNTLSFISDGYVLNPDLEYFYQYSPRVRYEMEIETISRPATINVLNGISATINIPLMRGSNSYFDLFKTGGGTLILGESIYGSSLNGDNKFIISEGTIKAANNVSLQNLTLNSGTMLDVDGYDVSVGSLNGSGSINLGSGNLSISNPWDSSVPFSGTIIGTGKLEFINSYENYDFSITLTGVNSYGGIIIDRRASSGRVGWFTVIGNSDSLKGDFNLGGHVRFDQEFDGTYNGNTEGYGTFIKAKAGELTVSGNFDHLQGTFVNEGSLRLDSAVISSFVTVSEGASLRGNGLIRGNNSYSGYSYVYGTLAPGGPYPGDYGQLTFADGLQLFATATVSFDLGNGNSPGTDYDTIRVYRNINYSYDFILNGTLEVSAISAGTYVLFDYNGANFSSQSYESLFQTTKYKLNGVNVNAVLGHNIETKLITVTIGMPNQSNITWNGKGSSGMPWDENQSWGLGNWADGQAWINQPGNIPTFAGTGDVISLYGKDKSFDTLIFTGNGYTLAQSSNPGLLISPASGNTGFVNVAAGLTATIRSTISGEGQALSKIGQGNLTLGGSHTYTGVTTVSEGTLFLEKNSSLASGQLVAENGTAMTGHGVVNGQATIKGVVSPGGTGTDYGRLTFAGGLTLEETARIIFDMGTGSSAGSSYDTVVVSGGSLVLGGTLDVSAVSSGTYTLFNYDGAAYSSAAGINDEFLAKIITVNGAAASGVLALDSVGKTISISISLLNQIARQWNGTGSQSSWSDIAGKWDDGVQGWTGQPGNVLTFAETGETVVLSGSAKDFDTLQFTVNGYRLVNGALNISPDPDRGITGDINVESGIRAAIYSPITGTGKQLNKLGQGTLALGGANTYTGGTLVSDGTLFLDDGVLAEGQLVVKGAGTLAGNGEVGGQALVQGVLSVGGPQDGDYGMLTFLEGLTLAGSSSVIFHLGDGVSGPGDVGTAGEDYDSVRVSGGSLVLAGRLLSYAASAGTYTLFNYAGASYEGDVRSDFAQVTATLNGTSAKAALENNALASLITLTVSLGNQDTTVHEGSGEGSELAASGNSDTGQVITFTGTGETVTVTGGGQTSFDTLVFSTDGYELTGAGLEISPDSGTAGVINVLGTNTATVGNDISGSGQSLSKVGDGTLVLTGDNDYDGGTSVEQGVLRGNIASGTDLAVGSVATYDGAEEAREVGVLSGSGAVVNTAGLTVAEGEFAGTIDDSNRGGLAKVGSGTLILTGDNAYAGGTRVEEGTLKGNIASGTDLEIESGAAYDGAEAARVVGELAGDGAVVNTYGLTVAEGEFGGEIGATNTGGLVKAGEGTLYLTGSGNAYAGGTTVTAGTLKGNIADGTDLAVAEEAVYDGDQAARTISTLAGSGSIVNTDGLTVSDGKFEGNIDATNTGVLNKVGEGELYLTGENSYEGGTTVSAGKLVGTSSSLQGVIDILDSAILGFDQDDDGTFEGVMSGGGDAFKRGAGSLVLEGTQAARQVDVYGGGLIVGAASQSSAELGADIVNVYSGAFLGGHGTVSSDVVVHAGGRLSPGNSYGITRIGGDLEFKSGSYFDVEVNPFNTAEGDVAYVSGTAYLAGIVRHLETGGTADDYLKAGNEWLILDAADLSGTFDGAVSNLAFLLPQLRYDDVNADVYLSFVRGGATFADFADTRNRRSVAAALESLDPGSVLLTEIAYSGTTVDQVPGLLDDLSGEMHGAVGGGLFQLGRGFANMLSRHVGGLSRFGSGAPAPAAGSPGQGGNSFWAVAGGTYTVMKGTGETARATLTGPEVSVGYDHVSADGWLAGLAFQYGYKKMKMGARSSEAEVNSLTVGLYGGREVRLGPGALRVVLSGSYSHHDIDSTRRVFMGTAAQTLEASYSARSLAGDLEVAYRFPVTGSLSLEPYARIGVQRIRFGGFAERGGSAALTSLGESWSHAVSTAGLRLLLAGNDRVSFSADLGWQHTFGNLAPSATYAFREGGSGFSVTGSPMNRNEALVGLELGINVTDSVSFQLGYNGSFGSRGQSHGGNAMVEVKW